MAWNLYPYTDFHEMNLSWVIATVKRLTEEWAETLTEWHDTQEEWAALKEYVENYFATLDVQEEINNKINDMIEDGTFQEIVTPIIEAKVALDLPDVVADQIGPVVDDKIGAAVGAQIGDVVADQVQPYVATETASWLADHITNPSNPPVDTSLTVGNAAADAEVVGDRFDLIYDERNLCFGAEFHPGYYFETTEHAAATYSYFKFAVTSGHTYRFTGKIRYLSDGTPSVIAQNADGGYTWTPAYSGYAYVTFYNEDPVWVITEASSVTGIAPFRLGKGFAVELEDVKDGRITPDARNLLNDAFMVKGKYYNGSETVSSTYNYYIVPVTNGTTYKFYPGVRFLCKKGSTSIVTNQTTPVEYTADFTGDIYVTMWAGISEYFDRKMCLPGQKFVLPTDVINVNYRANQYIKFNRAQVLNVGDSIAENRSGSTNYARQFCSATFAALARDVAESGATLSLTADQGTRGCIYSQILDTVTNYASADYDIVMIDGGTNDWGQNRTVGAPVNTGGEYKEADYSGPFDVTTVAGALEEIFRLIRATYTAATIVFVIPHKNTRTNAYYYQILDVLREVCYKWSVTVVDMDKDGELNTRILAMRTDFTDAGGTHPNTLGIQTFYLPRIIEALLRSFNRSRY